MNIEDQYLDVLQNIELAIVSAYKKNHNLRDYDVMRALDALIENYRVESRGQPPRKVNLPAKNTLIFELIRDMCEFRLGRRGLRMDEEIMPAANNTVDEILACLKRIRKSVDKWNKHGGPLREAAFPTDAEACSDISCSVRYRLNPRPLT